MRLKKDLSTTKVSPLNFLHTVWKESLRRLRLRLTRCIRKYKPFQFLTDFRFDIISHHKIKRKKWVYCKMCFRQTNKEEYFPVDWINKHFNFFSFHNFQNLCTSSSSLKFEWKKSELGFGGSWITKIRSEFYIIT